MDSQERDKVIAKLISEGTSLSDVQKILEKEHDYKITYMELRLVSSSLEVNWDAVDEKNNLIKGKVGKNLNIDQGYHAAAKRCGLSIISQVKKACDGDLSRVKSCIKLTGYVNSVDDFIDQPKVINGASEIISKVFGKKGLHTRAAISSNSLPLGVAVEVDAIFELDVS